MIGIWNRKELTITFSMEEQYRIRDLLSRHHIPYSLNVKSMQHSNWLGGGSRSRQGSFGLNMDFTREYIFYVKRSDFDLALAAIHGRIDSM